MVWQFILYAVVIMVSFAVSSIALLQPIITLRVALPISKSVYALMPDSGIGEVLKLNRFTVFFYAVVDLLIIAAVVMFVPVPYSYAAAIGAVLCLILSAGKTGINNDNLEDYLAVATRHIKPEAYALTAETLERVIEVLKK